MLGRVVPAERALSKRKGPEPEACVRKIRKGPVQRRGWWVAGGVGEEGRTGCPGPPPPPPEQSEPWGGGLLPPLPTPPPPGAPTPKEAKEAGAFLGPTLPTLRNLGEFSL